MFELMDFALPALPPEEVKFYAPPPPRAPKVSAILAAVAEVLPPSKAVLGACPHCVSAHVKWVPELLAALCRDCGKSFAIAHEEA